MSLTPSGMSIQSVYRLYRDKQLTVNRRYQRKLVWTTEEKRQLINSVLNDYPIPLFLLAENVDKGAKNYEIIDGMQRLHTLFSFIENSFDFDGKYFDLKEFARARQLAEEGAFPVPDESRQVLDKKSCANFLDYQLAVTIYPASSESAVTDVFNRINSYGRRLSPQERRQVSAASPFSEVVRRVSAEIRGDTSPEKLLLFEMPEVSIDSSTLKLGYGIRAEGTIWVSQGIFNTNSLRTSEDEQFIADILATVLLHSPFPASQEAFDDLYNIEHDSYKSANLALQTYGSEKLLRDVKAVFSLITDGLANKPKGFLRSTIRSSGGGNPIKTEFYAFFMALFELVVRQEKTPTNFDSVLKSVENLSAKMKKASHYVTAEDRKQNIDIALGLIQNHFVKKDPSLLGHGQGLYLDLVNSIRRSQVETSLYEFKQGILTLSDDRLLNENNIKAIVETICAIANCGPDIPSGFVFIGVTDKKSDADRIKALDKIHPISESDRLIVGLNREAKLLGKDLEKYKHLIVEKISRSQLSDPLKTQVLGRVDMVDFQGLAVMRISIPPQRDLSSVGDKIFFREGSSTKEATGTKIAALTRLFQL